MNDGLELLIGIRHPNESDKALQACNDYLRLGSGRNYIKLMDSYEFLLKDSKPSCSVHTIRKWAQTFSWVDRANLFDADWERRKNEEREATLSFGVALDYERIEKLRRLASLLETQIYEKEGETFNRVWLPDVKSVGSGDNVERVDIEKFNSPLISEYRSVLDDLAKESGGRVRRQEVSAKVEHNLLSDEERADRVTELLEIAKKRKENEDVK